MFRCAICKRTGNKDEENRLRPGSKPVKVVTKTRPTIYKNTVPDPEDPFATIDKVSTGSEIVEEIDVCQDCYKDLLARVEKEKSKAPVSTGEVRRINRLRMED